MNSIVKVSAIEGLPRDEYGALNLRLVLSAEQEAQVAAFLSAAVKANLLPAPFATFGKKEFECLNLDMESAPSRPLRLGYLQGPSYLLLLKRMLCCAWTKGRQQKKGAPDEHCVAFEKPPNYLFKRHYANDIR